MKIEVLGGYGGESLGCRMTCLLINDSIALDAGSLSQALPIERQVGVDCILLTHSHMDHTSSIPFFVENVFSQRDRALDVYASSATIYAIRKYLLNNATWPDFTRLPNHLLPAVKFHELQDEVPIELDGGVRFTPIPVHHLVPTHGFLIEQGDQAVLWSSDTGPTQRLWEIANNCRNLKAACVETSFDNSLQPIADVSYHLTPRTLELELEKLEKKVPVLLHHLKPPCVDQVRAEVGKLANPDIDFLEQGKVYEF
ncbi:MAG: 3',5'-cyclic-nucleotide phosphodiesterase [Acidobacteriota bacterium]